MLRAALMVAASVLLILPVARAEVIDVPLPDVAGHYDAAGYRSMDFDVGQGLSSVSGATISWRGTITPGAGHGDGVWIPEDEWFEWGAEFIARMEPDPPQTGFWYAWVRSEEGGFDEVTAFHSSLSPGWEFLLDGVGEVQVRLAPDISIGGVMVTPPSGHLVTATLHIDTSLTPVENVSWSSIKALFR
jgi:hypothetical protein